MAFNDVFNSISAISWWQVHPVLLNSTQHNILSKFPSITSTFFFSPRCFKKAINPFPNKPWFLRVCITSLLKTLWEKKKLLVTSNFSFSHCVFYLFGELSAIFIKFTIVVCQRFEFGTVKKLSFGKELKVGIVC